MEEKYENWITAFMDSWRDLDWNKTISLIAKDAKYYENPIDAPCKNFEEIVNLWNVVEKNQKDISYTFHIISCREDCCIVNWQMERTFIPTKQRQLIDGIFQISLNTQGFCQFFKQWRFTKIEE